nr:hypothetical protein [Lysobacter psychrotolerans]
MVDQFPGDAAFVQVGGHLSRPRGAHRAVHAPGDARDGGQFLVRRQGLHQLQRRALSFATHDHVDRGFGGQHVLPVVGRKHAAIHDPQRGQTPLQLCRDLRHRGMRRGRPRVPDHQRIRSPAVHLGDDGFHRHRPELGIQQLHLEACIEQRPADAQQPQRRQLLARDAAADCGVRRVQQEDAQRGCGHGRFREGVAGVLLSRHRVLAVPGMLKAPGESRMK